MDGIAKQKIMQHEISWRETLAVGQAVHSMIQSRRAVDDVVHPLVKQNTIGLREHRGNKRKSVEDFDFQLSAERKSFTRVRRDAQLLSSMWLPSHRNARIPAQCKSRHW
jgi:hypothetical protein